MRAMLCVVLWACGCGGDGGTVQTLSTAPGELTAITFNMYYGLSNELVPEDLRLGSLSATMQAIINATSLTDFRCRIQGAANLIVAEDPDVIGLQEALLISYARDLDDRDDDSTIVDFLDEMIDAIERAGGPRYQGFQRENALLQDSLPLVGGIRIADRSAILVHPRLPAKQVGSLTYATLQPASDVGGNGGVVVRGALHVQVPFASGPLDFYNTHLQSMGDPGVRQAQAEELAAWIRANSAPNASAVVLTGDLNDVPTSMPIMTLSALVTDTYGAVGVPPGLTAYQPQTLDNPTDEATVRIDYVMTSSTEIDDSRVIFNEHVAPCNLWPSDHFGVVSRFKTGASPLPARPSE